MAEQGDATFGKALKAAIRAARMSQADLAREMSIDQGQMSRWATDKAVPHIEAVARMEEILGADLSAAFAASTPEYELYVSAPITGLSRKAMSTHHAQVSQVVDSVRTKVNSLYWPGEGIKSVSDLVAPDIATERNLKVMAHAEAFLYLQFADIVRPSSSLIELGFALGKRLKTTLIFLEGVEIPYMINSFGAVAASLSFLPKARIYTVKSVDAARDLIGKNGRELLGLT
jgi:transcriptional regulator with XRE-family HTH domain